MQQRFTLDALFIAMCLLGNPLKDNEKYVQTWIMSHLNYTLIECLGAHYLQYLEKLVTYIKFSSLVFNLLVSYPSTADQSLRGVGRIATSQFRE